MTTPCSSNATQAPWPASPTTSTSRRRQLVEQAEAWSNAELLVKVKEPIAAEYQYLRDDLTKFTYLHLAADRPLTQALLDARTLAIAYETVQNHTGLPLLTPMSEIAGDAVRSCRARRWMVSPSCAISQCSLCNCPRTHEEVLSGTRP